MDGHFVPNITIGPPVVRAIKRVATVPLDVHLMIEEPDRYIDDFVAAGASMISVHVEAVPHLHRTMHCIKKLGARAGVVLNPATPASSLEDIAADVDFVLVMSVNPGSAARRSSRNSLEKLRRVRECSSRAAPRRPSKSTAASTSPTPRTRGRRGRQHPRRGQRHLRRRPTPRRRRAPCARRAPPPARAPDQRRRDARAEASRRARHRRRAVRVRYAETDRMGVVYYANYLVWFEVGRTEWLRETGWSYREMEHDGIALPGDRGALRVPAARALRR